MKLLNLAATVTVLSSGLFSTASAARSLRGFEEEQRSLKSSKKGDALEGGRELFWSKKSKGDRELYSLKSSKKNGAGPEEGRVLKSKTPKNGAGPEDGRVLKSKAPKDGAGPEGRELLWSKKSKTGPVRDGPVRDRELVKGSKKGDRELYSKKGGRRELNSKDSKKSNL